MLICPTERVVGAKGGLQSESLQTNQTEVQDHPKQTARAQSQGCITHVVDHSEASLNGDVQDPEYIDQDKNRSVR